MERQQVMNNKEKTIDDFYTKEFPYSMTAEEISVKLDTFAGNPDIQLFQRKIL